jgi:hypothetical protein
MKMILIICIVCLCFFTIIGCTSSNSKSSADCVEPENPYSADSGHYAGFEWAAKNDPSSCGGNSASFIEGCEAYQKQLAAYEECSEAK